MYKTLKFTAIYEFTRRIVSEFYPPRKQTVASKCTRYDVFLFQNNHEEFMIRKIIAINNSAEKAKLKNDHTHQLFYLAWRLPWKINFLLISLMIRLFSSPWRTKQNNQIRSFLFISSLFLCCCDATKYVFGLPLKIYFDIPKEKLLQSRWMKKNQSFQPIHQRLNFSRWNQASEKVSQENKLKFNGFRLML